MRGWLPVALAVAAVLPASGCGSGERSAKADAAPVRPNRPFLPERYLRSPDAKTSMDTNPANLASAVITYSFGQLPHYIDDAEFRLLPHEIEQTSVPGKTLRTAYRITVPQTSLVLDAVYTAAPASAETKQLARAWTIDVSLDGRHVADPERYWVFYRNNGPQICRIYFPGDLGSLNMGANSMVFFPLEPGNHRLLVDLRHRLTATQPLARIVYDYRLKVLPRRPNAREIAIAPDEEGPPPANNRTPLTFRTNQT